MDSLNETCTAIESETWKFSKRYNEQFRALKSNLSDSTNNDFWRDILMGKISPREAATMSSVDMASQAKKKQREEAIKLTTEGYVRNAMENRERETKLRLEKKVHRGEIVEKTPEANDSQFRLLEDFKKDSLTALPPSGLCVPCCHFLIMLVLFLQIFHHHHLFNHPLRLLHQLKHRLLKEEFRWNLQRKSLETVSENKP